MRPEGLEQNDVHNQFQDAHGLQQCQVDVESQRSGFNWIAVAGHDFQEAFGLVVAERHCYRSASVEV